MFDNLYFYANKSWSEYERAKCFIEKCSEVGVRVDNFSADIQSKRALLRIMYTHLNGPGKDNRIPLDQCDPARIGKAFTRIYQNAKKLVEETDKGLNKLMLESKLENLIEFEQWLLKEDGSKLKEVMLMKIGERIAIKLDSCSDEKLKEIKEKYGLEVLGGYKVFV